MCSITYSAILYFWTHHILLKWFLYITASSSDQNYLKEEIMFYLVFYLQHNTCSINVWWKNELYHGRFYYNILGYSPQQLALLPKQPILLLHAQCTNSHPQHTQVFFHDGSRSNRKCHCWSLVLCGWISLLIVSEECSFQVFLKTCDQ